MHIRVQDVVDVMAVLCLVIESLRADPCRWQ